MRLPGDDAAIVAQVLAGETDRFAELVHRYQALLYRYALSVVHDRDVAADMVQDAFVRTYTHLDRCRDPDAFRAWLFRTLRNRCLDHLKDPRRRHTALDAAASMADHAEGPDDRAARRELGADIRRALDSLPDRQREAFLLHYVEGLSYEEMAGLLGASVSALKMRALRAREALAAQVRTVTSAPAASSDRQAAVRFVSRDRPVGPGGHAPAVFTRGGRDE